MVTILVGLTVLNAVMLMIGLMAFHSAQALIEQNEQAKASMRQQELRTIDALRRLAETRSEMETNLVTTLNQFADRVQGHEGSTAGLWVPLIELIERISQFARVTQPPRNLTPRTNGK